MLKIEQINSFLGFGEGIKNGEYYFSVGMMHKRKGIEPGWYTVKSSDSSTISAGSGYKLVTEFTERNEAGTYYNYAVDENGVIAKCQHLLDAWSRQHIPGTTGHGNGLIVGHSTSQRLLYVQDEYVGSYDGVVWYDTFMDLGWSLNIPKSPDIYEDWVVIPNGSTVALLNITDDSKTYSGFTFPPDFECSIARAGTNGVLLGGNFNKKGFLVLWDCQLDRSLAPWIWVNGGVAGIAKYNGIWVVATNREIIITDGYEILKKYSYPDTSDTNFNVGPDLPSGMKVDEDKLIIATNVALLNRRKMGFYILDFRTGLWEFAPTSDFNLSSDCNTGAVFINGRHRRLVSHGDSFLAPDQDYISRIYNTSGSDSYFICEVGAQNDSKKRAEAIILSLGFALQSYGTVDDPGWTIGVKLYDFRRTLWGYALAKITSLNANEITIDNTVYHLNAQVGDEVTVLEGSNAGEARHIASITGAGTDTELWTMDSAFSNNTEMGAYLNISPFLKVGEKTLDTYQIHDDRLFVPIKKSMVGRKFLVKVSCSFTSMKPHFRGLSFIYDEL